MQYQQLHFTAHVDGTSVVILEVDEMILNSNATVFVSVVDPLPRQIALGGVRSVMHPRLAQSTSPTMRGHGSSQ